MHRHLEKKNLYLLLMKELALLTQKTVEEVKQDLFGEYIFEEKDLHKRPLSKLIKDIAQELGLV